MIHAVEKLLNIAFQYKARPRSVRADFSHHSFERFYSFVIAESYPAGKRGGNKSFFKNRVDDGKDGVVKDAVAHRRFVDVPLFRVPNIKAFVSAMLVGFIFQLTMKLKYILLETPLESPNIFFLPFIALKRVPR